MVARYWRTILAGIGVLAIAVSIVGPIRANRALTERVEREGIERRDQQCVLFERLHAAAVQRLVETYEFLREHRDTQLGRAVLVALPRAEADARLSVAPHYCDRDGVGLPGPNPRIPRRPPELATG